MSASPETEAKVKVDTPAFLDTVEENEQPEHEQPGDDGKAASPVAGDDDDGENEGQQEQEQEQDKEEDENLAKPNTEEVTAETVGDENNGEEEGEGGGGSDDESILSEVDEAQFEDFDPEQVDVEDRPQLAIDEENLKLVGRHKRKRTEEGGDGERASRRKKEGRREKKSRRMKELEEGGEDGEGDGKSRRRERKKKDTTPEDEQLLDPETRMFPYLWTWL